jgi:oxygen-independent coproporphyrinogen III oxidase
MIYPSSEMVVDPAVIRKYDLSGPRYTSYPSADRFVEAFGEKDYLYWLAKRNIGGFLQPLSVYLHLPFCESLCFYCACNKVVTRDRRRSGKYINYLILEMSLISEMLGADRQVSHLHWGGGTPNFLTRDEMSQLMGAFNAHFVRLPDFEAAIEIDPRTAEPGLMGFLAELGFRRLSLGVQDFDPEVQKAIHRIQGESVTRRVMEEAKAEGYRSINVDLIYGLPKQTLDGFNSTLDRIIELNPDRIALYRYAHLPLQFKPQRRIAEADLPSAETDLQILTLAVGRLIAAGYLYIGMDHFAKPDDELALAQQQGRLHRNFQGYSAQAESDMLGFGVSAIGRVGPTYEQNLKNIEEYYAAIDAGRLPVLRGLILSQDDLVRRAVIQALICQFRLSLESIELAYLIEFKKYFSQELEELKQLEDDELVELQPDWIIVTPKGRLMVRIICMVFDRYLRQSRQRLGYSKVM